jgi:signal transduction histidine kinase
MDQMRKTQHSPPGKDEQEAKNLDDLHSKLTQNVSYKLRTQLTFVQGYAGLLSDGSLGALTPEQQEAVSAIVARADELRTLVERVGILLVAEAHATVSLPLALDEIVAEAVKERRATVAQARLALEVHLEPDLPLVLGDPYHLRQAVDCLLENTLKFTPSGGRVEVQVYSEPGRVCLAITDTGIGMAEEEQGRIFTHLYQMGGSLTRQYGEIGLGLTLVRAVIEEHGGRIKVQSGPGQGSQFTIELPALSPVA